MPQRRPLFPPRAKQDSPNVALAIVNIVFLLLFYFLVTGSQSTGPDFNIRISQVEDQPSANVGASVLLIGENGEIRLNDDQIDTAELEGLIKDVPRLDIVIDRKASARTLLQVLETPGFEALDMRLVTKALNAQK